MMYYSRPFLSLCHLDCLKNVVKNALMKKKGLKNSDNYKSSLQNENAADNLMVEMYFGK